MKRKKGKYDQSKQKIHGGQRINGSGNTRNNRKSTRVKDVGIQHKGIEKLAQKRKKERKQALSHPIEDQIEKRRRKIGRE